MNILKNLPLPPTPALPVWLWSILLLLALTALPGQAAYQPLSQFGDNPGRLSADLYHPTGHKKQQTLVVLLHGCAQQGKTFAQQSGWQQLADHKNFLLLVPRQSEKNNIKACFNWFSAQDIAKHSGESLSLLNMIKQVKTDHAIDTVNIAGLSAGAAMASVMLANYPELFTHGAIIAGLPYGCADGLIKAIACMKSGPKETLDELTALMQKNHHKAVQWPRVSIWYGDKDTIVNPKNARFMAQQWLQLHGAQLNGKKQGKSVHQGSDYHVTQWQNSREETLVQLVRLNGLGHGMPVKPNADGSGGTVAPFVIASPLAAAIELAQLWGL